MTLGLFQLSALVLRPHKDSRYRRAWNLMHWWVGRAAVLVATANTYEGIINVKRVGSGAVIAYTSVFASIVAAALLKDGCVAGAPVFMGSSARAGRGLDQQAPLLFKAGVGRELPSNPPC